MKYDRKAIQLVDQRAIELAQAICDASVSEEEARWILVHAGVVLHRRVRLGVAAPRFKERTTSAGETTTKELLQKFGIDHDCNSPGRSSGGD